MDISEFEDLFSKITNSQKNPFHPLVWIVGNPSIGKNVYVGGMSEIQAKDANVTIGDNCDIASFVSIMLQILINKQLDYQKKLKGKTL